MINILVVFTERTKVNYGYVEHRVYDESTKTWYHVPIRPTDCATFSESPHMKGIDPYEFEETCMGDTAVCVTHILPATFCLDEFDLLTGMKLARWSVSVQRLGTEIVSRISRVDGNPADIRQNLPNLRSLYKAADRDLRFLRIDVPSASPPIMLRSLETSWFKLPSNQEVELYRKSKKIKAGDIYAGDTILLDGNTYTITEVERPAPPQPTPQWAQGDDFPF